MKKLILILAIALFALPAYSQTCQMGVAWTPDPIGAPTVTGQAIYHDSDSTNGNGADTLVATVAANITQHQWTLSRACYAADRVYVVTTYTGGLTKASPKVAVQSVVGAVLSIAIRDNQP
jgi:hypothetical protein